MVRLRRLGFAALAAAAPLLIAANEAPALEDDVLARINAVRQDPAAYAEQLRDYRRHFLGNAVFLPDRAKGLLTQEGVAAVDEAIAFLEQQPALPPLNRASLLALAARHHVAMQGPLGEHGHVGPDGTSPGERVRKLGGGDLVGEDISYGYADADAVVRQLIVDDGVIDRGHRRLIFEPELRYAGVGCGEHRRYGHMCVIDVARTHDGMSIYASNNRLTMLASN
ncbi:CAP domain-containing protein [Sphingomonas sp. RS6]